jgi:RimJ/RimL family protein N-acetyltransferase
MHPDEGLTRADLGDFRTLGVRNSHKSVLRRRGPAGYVAAVESSARRLEVPIETERLLLRPFEERDLEHLLRIQTDPELTRWVPWPVRGPDEVEASLRLKMAATDLKADAGGVALAAVTREGRQFVADVTLHSPNEHGGAELGFMVLPEHHGQGYATEAARAMLALAFDGAGLHRVTARVEPRNEASWRVLERIGMRREAHFVENEWVKGEWQSEYAYAILAREWPVRVPTEER